MFAWSNGRSLSAGVELRQSLAGSPQHQAESSSPGQVSHCPFYGLVVRLRLLPTLPRGNAVTFDYTPEHRRGEDFHPSDSNLLSIALEPMPPSAKMPHRPVAPSAGRPIADEGIDATPRWPV